MTQSNFSRRYELSITNPQAVEDDVNPTIISGEPISGGSVSLRPDTGGGYRTVEETTVLLTDLQMRADIEVGSKTSGTKGVVASIKIFNLAEATKSIISDQNNYVILKAGYADQESDGLPIIFSGQVINSFTKREGHDIITYLECSDGYTAKNSIKISTEVVSGTYGDVFNKMASLWRDHGVATGEVITTLTPVKGSSILKSPDNTTLDKGYVFSGFLRRAMDDLCEMFNYSWQIINNQLFIHPKHTSRGSSVVELDTNTILSVNERQDGTKGEASLVSDKGSEIKLLLDGRITTVHRIRVLSGNFAGLYKVISLKHSLDFEGNEWSTTLTCSGVTDGS